MFRYTAGPGGAAPRIRELCQDEYILNDSEIVPHLQIFDGRIILSNDRKKITGEKSWYSIL